MKRKSARDDDDMIQYCYVSSIIELILNNLLRNKYSANPPHLVNAKISLGKKNFFLGGRVKKKGCERMLSDPPSIDERRRKFLNGHS